MRALFAAEVEFHLYPSPSNADTGEGIKESGNLQYPQNHSYDYDGIQD